MKEHISVLLIGVGKSLMDWLMCGMGLTGVSDSDSDSESKKKVYSDR